MHSRVDFAREQRIFELAGKESLTADLRQGTIQEAVACGRDDVFLTRKLRLRGLQQLNHVRSLPAGECRGSSGENDFHQAGSNSNPTTCEIISFAESSSPRARTSRMSESTSSYHKALRVSKSGICFANGSRSSPASSRKRS